RGRGNAPCHGHRGFLRHAGRHSVRSVPDPGLLRTAARVRPASLFRARRAGACPHRSTGHDSLSGIPEMIQRLPLAGAAGLLAVLLSGCAVGPEYQRPAVEIPAAFKEARLSTGETLQWKKAQPADSLARGRWWAVFQDPMLDSLEDQAMRANQDLKAAAARVEQARALKKTARSGLYPELTAGTGPTRQRTSDAS